VAAGLEPLATYLEFLMAAITTQCRASTGTAVARLPEPVHPGTGTLV
jgi:hypothetical protein